MRFSWENDRFIVANQFLIFSEEIIFSRDCRCVVVSLSLSNNFSISFSFGSGTRNSWDNSLNVAKSANRGEFWSLRAMIWNYTM